MAGVNGRWSRCYITRDCVIAVTYHRNIRGKLRQLTISPRLMSKVLR